MKLLLMGCTLAMAMLPGASTFGTQHTQHKVKVLASPEDATKKTVLIGRNVAHSMIVTFELEPAKAMWMEMGGEWVEHPVGNGEIFHVEVKPEDPKSKTRISYAKVSFNAVNHDNKKKVSGTLHPMWGGSGLHYAMNSPLAGDGTYEAAITIGTPMFARAPKDRDLWMKPVTTRFHFKLAGRKLVEVTKPSDGTQK